MATTDGILSQRMQGKYCLITGATNGIGRETAIGLARMGAELIILGRDRRRIDDTIAEIRNTTGSTAASSLVADLSSLDQIRRAADEYRSRFGRLDVLVNNAGVLRMRRELTADGYEAMFAVNHLAHFLLTALLLDTMRSSAPARIVNVASAAHAGASIDFDDLPGDARFNGYRRYGASKLANIMFTYELARRLEGTGITTNALHPGFVGSGFGSGNPGVIGRSTRALLLAIRPFARSPREGARTSIYLASAPELADVSGRYFVDCAEAESSTESYDVAAQQRLWALSEQLCGLASKAESAERPR